MLINKNWKVESDSRNITLLKRMNDKEDEKAWKAIGYYSNVKSTLNGLLRHEVKGTGMEDFQIIVNKVEEVKGLIENLDLSSLKESNNKVEISIEEYESLQDNSKKLDALDCVGVTNWGGYDDAMEIYNKESEEE